jgi:MbtH protein
MNISDQEVFLVVTNQKGQFSIWPKGKALPNGWRNAGKEGLKQECLEFINTVWMDMTPDIAANS